MKEKFQIVTKEFSLSLDRQASISPFITFQQDSKDSEEKYYTFRQFFIIVDLEGMLADDLFCSRVFRPKMMQLL